MARELGLNPRRLGGYAGNDKDPDRLSPGDFIEALYFKQFRKAHPDVVQTIEQLAEAHEVKRAERIAVKRSQAASSSVESDEVESDDGDSQFSRSGLD